MRLSSATSPLLALSLALPFLLDTTSTTTTSAFVVPTPSSATTRVGSLPAIPSDKDVNDNSVSMSVAKNVAMSWFTASVLAVSTVTMLPTVEIPGIVDSSLTGVPPAVALGKKDAPAVKLSKEEKERNAAKANLDLSQQTLKEYQKYVSDLNSASKKANSVAESTQKQAIAAKKQFVATSDKLSKAKSQKMPSSAVQELAKEAGTYMCLRLCVWCSFIDFPVTLFSKHYLYSPLSATFLNCKLYFHLSITVTFTISK